MGNIIQEWDSIKEKYTESLILGNGSSIAVNNSFKYDSLYDKASELDLINSELKTLFTHFVTTDFELILHKLLQATTVNHSFSIDNTLVDNAYKLCRESLVKVIQAIHPEYPNIDEKCLDTIANFLKRFKKVVTLNYDLIIYWVMYRGNQPIHDDSGNLLEHGNIFKDGFTEKSNGDKCFNPDWEFLSKPHYNRKSTTLVFYLHGNLSLASFIKSKLYELEVKIASPDTSHLDAIFTKWNSGNYSPLFVCEGVCIPLGTNAFSSMKSNMDSNVSRTLIPVCPNGSTS